MKQIKCIRMRMDFLVKYSKCVEFQYFCQVESHVNGKSQRLLRDIRSFIRYRHSYVKEKPNRCEFAK